jgi:glycerophosphoryl diester phosphodiesterase
MSYPVDTEANRTAIKEFRELRRRIGRTDLIFKGKDIYAPLLFAHRGGVWETPESTLRGFRYALEEAGADVLELDVQLTRDGRFVVWHGPELKNVFIIGVDPDPNKRPPGRRCIYEFDWCELNGKAWVADPCSKDLTEVLRSPDRGLLLLKDFLEIFKPAPLNIEMKGSFKMALGGRIGLAENVTAFRNLLMDAGYQQNVVVASADYDIIDAFRAINNDRFPTNLSFFEQVKLWVSQPKKSKKKRALETSYIKPFSGSGMIHKMRQLNWPTYVFITRFGPIKALDCPVCERSIREILDRGVDGIMTDRPKAIREIMHQWLKQHPDIR